MVFELNNRYKWICDELAKIYQEGTRYGQKCFIVDGDEVEAFTVCKLVAPGETHSLVLDYALTDDGLFSESGGLFPVEDYPDKQQMLDDILLEIGE